MHWFVIQHLRSQSQSLRMEIDISCNYTQLSIHVKYLSQSLNFFSEIIVTFKLPTTEAPFQQMPGHTPGLAL